MKMKYLSCAETAKLVRKALKEAFPGVPFRVKSHVYSGGASIDVKWCGGPLTRKVEAVAKAYQGGGFDGMIDLAYSRTHYLRADGTTLVAHDPGTTGSGGQHEPEDNRALEPVLPADAERVHFGANFIFCTRETPAGWRDEAEAYVRAHCVLTPGHTPAADRFGNEWIGDFVRRLVHHHLEGEGWDVTMAEHRNRAIW